MSDPYTLGGWTLIVVGIVVGVPYLIRRWRRISAKVDAQMAAEQHDPALDAALMWGEFERQFGPATKGFVCKEPGCNYRTTPRNTTAGALMDCAEHEHSSWLFNRPTQEQP